MISDIGKTDMKPIVLLDGINFVLMLEVQCASGRCDMDWEPGFGAPCSLVQKFKCKYVIYLTHLPTPAGQY